MTLTPEDLATEQATRGPGDYVGRHRLDGSARGTGWPRGHAWPRVQDPDYVPRHAAEQDVTGC